MKSVGGLICIFSLFLLSLFLSGIEENGVKENSVTDELLEMSLEEVLSVEIISASKKNESIFDAPISSSVLTHDEILRSGATSIPEALKLIPGIIVFEQTNGVYDIHIRGFNNLPPNQSMSYAANTITLVMIDNRIVYNFFNGGTFWETLPVDISDIERIEVVRGPASALYGPNAVSGVIHIITKSARKEGFSGNAEGAGGDKIKKGSFLMGYKSGSFSFKGSGNFDERARYENGYFLWGAPGQGNYGYGDSKESVVGSSGQPYENFEERYPEQDLALRKFGVNSGAKYDFSDKIRFSLDSGYQKSRVQKPFVETFRTPFTTVDGESYYGDFKAKIYDLNIHADMIKGFQDTLGIEGNPNLYYDFNVLNSEADYDLTFDKLNIKQSLSFRRAEYKGDWLAKFSTNSEGELEAIDDTAVISSLGYALRAEYSLFEKLRFIAAGRADAYEHNKEKIIPGWQLATTFKLTDDQILRLSYGRAVRSPFMLNTHAELFAPSYINSVTLGNKKLEPVTTDTVEAGYRGSYSNFLLVDFEVFYSKIRNFDKTEEKKSTIDFGGIKYLELPFENSDLTAEQIGATFSTTIFAGNKFEFRPFATIQNTKITGELSPLFGTKTESYNDERYYGTPAFYGGASMIVKPHKKIGINLSCYGYSSYKFYSGVGGEGGYKIDRNLLLNGKISYNLTDETEVFFTFRNIGAMGPKQQFAGTDTIDSTVVAGLTTNF